MAGWNPAAVRAQYNLVLTEAEKAQILAQLPPAEDGNRYADAVFEGGGVKGTAFLGVLRCFSEVGIRWRKLAGTSAGSITAALVAAEIEIEELEAALGQLDYVEDLLSEPTSRFLFQRSPDRALDNPLGLVANLWVTQQLGKYSTDPLRDWVAGILGDRLHKFADLSTSPDLPWYQRRALKIVVSDITHGEMLVLPDDLERDVNQAAMKQYNLNRRDDFSVAEAVRLSSSIPFFFEPGRLGDATIVDGGILSNFPLWIFDLNQAAQPNPPIPRCPTFGFRIADEMAKFTIDSAIDVFSAMLTTIMVAKDRFHLRKNGQGRVINIDTTGVTATQFNLSNADKDRLYRQGYEATRAFLLNEWNWAEHLRSRGYDVA